MTETPSWGTPETSTPTAPSAPGRASAPAWGTPDGAAPAWGAPETVPGGGRPSDGLPSRRVVLERLDRKPLVTLPTGRRARVMAGVAGVAGATLVAGLVLLGAFRPEASAPPSEAGLPVADGPLVSLAFGACFDGALRGGTVRPASCDRPHGEQYVGGFRLPSGSFPGDALIAEQSVRRCMQVFSRFTGGSLLDQHELRLDWSLLEEDDWDRGVREVLCAVARVDGTELIGSVRT